MDSEAQGGCQCGAIRYAIVGPPDRSLVCHCPDCRRSVGAHAVAWVVVPKSNFKVLTGTPRQFASSVGIMRSFCDTCGTTLTWARDAPATHIAITIGSLEDPNRIAPAQGQPGIRQRHAQQQGAGDLPGRQPRRPDHRQNRKTEPGGQRDQ